MLHGGWHCEPCAPPPPYVLLMPTHYAVPVTKCPSNLTWVAALTIEHDFYGRILFAFVIINIMRFSRCKGRKYTWIILVSVMSRFLLMASTVVCKRSPFSLTRKNLKELQGSDNALTFLKDSIWNPMRQHWITARRETIALLIWYDKQDAIWGWTSKPNLQGCQLAFCHRSLPLKTLDRTGQAIDFSILWGQSYYHPSLYCCSWFFCCC